MTITITAFADSPDKGRGHARDMRVRWALEEVGQSYEVKLVPFADTKKADNIARQPFGQIPAYEEDGLTLFETGSIVFHIAERHQGLFPLAADARAMAITWMFAALNSLEPAVIEREGFLILERDKPWFEARLPILDERVRGRLKRLSDRLGDAEWLESEFTAGDLMMVMVLRRPASAMLLGDFPNLAAYVARGEARPAFQRAYAAQRAVFEANEAKAN